MTSASSDWREANPDRVRAYNARRRAEYAAQRQPSKCSVCGTVMERAGKVVCSRRCKDRRYARLHPEQVREKRRRKDARRRERAKAG